MIPILFIDHEDSFSENLVALLRNAGAAVTMISCQDQQLPKGAYAGLVLSPGPGHPSEYLQTRELLRQLPQDLPILGVCLGLQLLLHEHGLRVEPLSPSLPHGRIYPLPQIPSTILQNFSYGGDVVFYNSLGIRAGEFLKNSPFICQLLDSWGYCAIAEHRYLPRIGVQFHPESFASTEGLLLIKAFISYCFTHRSTAQL